MDCKRQRARRSQTNGRDNHFNSGERTPAPTPNSCGSLALTRYHRKDESLIEPHSRDSGALLGEPGGSQRGTFAGGTGGTDGVRRAFARTADGSRMRAGDAGSHRFAGNDGHGRPAVLRIRDRWLASGGAGGELAGRRLGSVPRPVRGVADRDRAGRGLPGLAAGCAETSGRFRRSIRDRRHHGQLHCAGGGAAHGAGTRRMGRRSRRTVRRAADHRSGGRRGASVADQGAGNARLGAFARGAGSGGWSGPDARC